VNPSPDQALYQSTPSDKCLKVHGAGFTKNTKIEFSSGILPNSYDQQFISDTELCLKLKPSEKWSDKAGFLNVLSMTVGGQRVYVGRSGVGVVIAKIYVNPVVADADEDASVVDEEAPLALSDLVFAVEEEACVKGSIVTVLPDDRLSDIATRVGMLLEDTDVSTSEVLNIFGGDLRVGFVCKIEAKGTKDEEGVAFPPFLPSLPSIHPSFHSSLSPSLFN
jgi:hypothetical protein